MPLPNYGASTEIKQVEGQEIRRDRKKGGIRNLTKIIIKKC